MKSENSAGRSSEFKVKEGRSGNRETGVPGPGKNLLIIIYNINSIKLSSLIRFMLKHSTQNPF